MKPLVSIIIPAYNSEKWIDKTISSVREQTFSNWELIIINDGSTDLTEEKIKLFLEDNKKTFYTSKAKLLILIVKRQSI